jgi:hypothetical protein
MLEQDVLFLVAEVSRQGIELFGGRRSEVERGAV